MTIRSMVPNQKWYDNYDKIFKKKLEDTKHDGAHPCFCVGPAPGETKCPCALKQMQEVNNG